MVPNNTGEFCPLCQNSSKKSKLHLISSKNNEAYFCWNCTNVWPKRKRSFIEQLKNESKNYTWGDAYFDNNQGREELIKWKIDYLEKLFKIGANKSQVIDFGCGPGIALEACQRLGIKAIGIEVDPANYNYCNSRGFEVILSDFNDLTRLNNLLHEDKTLVLFNNSLIYNKNIYELMNNINPRNLRNIDIAIHDQNYFLNTRNPIGVIKSPKSGFIFSTPSIKKLLNYAKFKVIYSQNYFGTQYVLARSTNIHIPSYRISKIIKIIHYIYAYNLIFITPLITFTHKNFLEPLKEKIKNLMIKKYNYKN